jgi:dipeptidyl aminopeptidase/acylaminoacyl peptidase
VIALVCAALCGLALAVRAPSRDTVEGTNIFVVKADGTGRRNLTAGSTPARRVLRALSPNGRTLAYDQLNVEGGNGWWSVEVASTSGGAARRLAGSSGSSAYAPAWSLDGQLIAFEVCCSPHGIDIARTDGTRVSSIGDASNPTWLAGRRVAFLEGGDVATEIATARSDGSERWIVVTVWDLGLQELEGLTPSPSGRKIAFAAVGESGQRLFSVGLTGVPLSMLSRDGWQASWSPSSRRIVFVTYGGLVTTRPDGTGRRRFRATQNLSPGPPSWSPDGTRIAFVANSSNSLVLLNVRHGSTRVVARDVDGQQPRWSPNGRRLYYAAPTRG